MINITKNFPDTVEYFKAASILIVLFLSLTWCVYFITVAVWPVESSFAEFILFGSSFIVWISGVIGIIFGVTEYFFD